MLIALYLPKAITLRHKHLKDLYKASAIVLIFINMVTFVSDLCLHAYYFFIEVLLKEDSIVLILVYPLIKSVLMLIISSLDISVVAHYGHKFGHGSKCMFVFALIQVIWFVHRLATDTILFIFAFIIAPAQTLGTVILLLSTIVCTILFVSSLLNKCQAGCTADFNKCNYSTDDGNLYAIIYYCYLCHWNYFYSHLVVHSPSIDNGLQWRVHSLTHPTNSHICNWPLC